MSHVTGTGKLVAAAVQVLSPVPENHKTCTQQTTLFSVMCSVHAHVSFILQTCRQFLPVKHRPKFDRILSYDPLEAVSASLSTSGGRAAKDELTPPPLPAGRDTQRPALGGTGVRNRSAAPAGRSRSAPPTRSVESANEPGIMTRQCEHPGQTIVSLLNQTRTSLVVQNQRKGLVSPNKATMQKLKWQPLCPKWGFFLFLRALVQHCLSLTRYLRSKVHKTLFTLQSFVSKVTKVPSDPVSQGTFKCEKCTLVSFLCG